MDIFHLHELPNKWEIIRFTIQDFLNDFKATMLTFIRVTPFSTFEDIDMHSILILQKANLEGERWIFPGNETYNSKIIR